MDIHFLFIIIDKKKINYSLIYELLAASLVYSIKSSTVWPTVAVH